MSFEDVQDTKQIVANKNQNTEYPLLIAEILQYVISGKRLRESEFLEFLQEKYPFINFKNELSGGHTARLSLSQKKKIIEILTLIQQKQ